MAVARVKSVASEYAYQEGDEKTAYTGGWDDNTSPPYYEPVTYNADNIQITASNVEDCGAQTVDKIDLTDINLITVDYDLITTSVTDMFLQIQLRDNRNERIPDGNANYVFLFSYSLTGRRVVEFTEASDGTSVPDITGEWYVYWCATADASGSVDAKMYNLTFEALDWQRVKKLKNKQTTWQNNTGRVKTGSAMERIT